jgi:hypothetical protein
MDEAEAAGWAGDEDFIGHVELGLGVVKGVVVPDLEQTKVVVDFVGQIEGDYIEHVYDDEERIHLDRVADQDELIDGKAE